LFGMQLPQPWRSAQIETLRAQIQNRRSRAPNRPLHPLSPGHRLAVPEPVPLACPRRQQRLT